MNATPSATARDAFSQWPSCFQAIFPAPANRRDWLEINFGWLLAPTLDGPVLVFAPADEAWANVKLQELYDARANFHRARQYARANRTAYKHSIMQLRRACSRLVKRAVGYTYAGAQLDGARVLFAFDA